MFVDSDDKLAPGAIDALHDRFADCEYVTGSYSNMSADGRIIANTDGPRNHGAAVGAAFLSRGLAAVGIPRGILVRRHRHQYLHLSCLQGEEPWRACLSLPGEPKGITANAGRSKKGVDTLLGLERLLGWNEDLGMPFRRENVRLCGWPAGFACIGQNGCIGRL